MKNKPNIRCMSFSDEMVRAILDGRKTVTRQPFSGPVRKSGECPFGRIGDRIAVRECWASTDQIMHPSDAWIVYRATEPEWGKEYEGWRWRPAMHMPKAASRITLEITDVRVERLQAMNDDDAMAEGIQPCYEGWHLEDGRFFDAGGPVDAFRQLWDSIYGDRTGLAWHDDPLVWAIGFRVVEVRK